MKYNNLYCFHFNIVDSNSGRIFFNNNYNYPIIVVQPASADDYCNSQDSEGDTSSDGEGKDFISCSCFANDLHYT